MCRRDSITGWSSCSSSVDIALAAAREAGASVSSYASTSDILSAAKMRTTRTHHKADSIGEGPYNL